MFTWQGTLPEEENWFEAVGFAQLLIVNSRSQSLNLTERVHG
jgi:hypothetical protein